MAAPRAARGPVPSEVLLLVLLVCLAFFAYNDRALTRTASTVRLTQKQFRRPPQAVTTASSLTPAALPTPASLAQAQALQQQQLQNSVAAISQQQQQQASQLQEQQQIGGAGAMATVAQPAPIVRPPLQPGCKRLLWFISLSDAAHSSEEYWHSLAAAVMSAREKAPSLQPVLVYLGQPNARTAWFEAQGGILLPHRLSFRDQLDEAVAKGWRDPSWMAIEGAWGRLDAPCLVDLAVGRLGNPAEYDAATVLYTDVDVLFFKDLDTCSFPQPPPAKLSFGAEWRRGALGNAGVSLLNASAVCRDRPALLELAGQRQWQLPTHDQSLLMEFYAGQIDFMADEFNWKAYWGDGPAVAVVHMHGPKLTHKCTSCFVDQRAVPTDPSCMCPEAYNHLFEKALAADGGNYFHHLLDVYRRYVGQAHLPPAGNH